MILGAVAIATEIKTTNLIPPVQQLSGVVITCSNTALEKRENAVISAVTAYQTTELASLNDRKSGLLTAWNKTTKSELKSAVSAVRKIYKATISGAKSVLRTAKESAWTTYKNDIRVCK